MRLRTHYYQQFDADLARPVPAEGYGGWRLGEVELAREHTALVLMHAWDCGTPAQYPGWFRACEEILRSYRVCRDVLPPLLAAVRRAGLPLFHVVTGGHYYRELPGYRRAVALAGPTPAVVGAEPDPVHARLQRWRAEHVFPGAHNEADAARGWGQVRFAPGTEPVGDEGVAEDAHQLTALCRERGVNHLVYAGFCIDWCLLMSPGGMVDMSRRAFLCSVLRDAVVAVENRETARTELGKAVSLWRVSVGLGLVFDSADFVAALAAGDAEGPPG